MPNRPTIDVYKRVNERNGAIDYTVDVYDNYAHTTLVFAEKSEISDDDLELLKIVVKASSSPDEHGTSCEIVYDILDYIREHKTWALIGGQRYEWEQIKEILEAKD